MRWEVIFSREAAEDLERIFDHLLAREMASASTDLAIPERAIAAIRQACQWLAHSPFSCRKADHRPGANPFVRELIIAFGATGYVALFEIRENHQVIIGAIRHQREDDYH